MRMRALNTSPLHRARFLTYTHCALKFFRLISHATRTRTTALPPRLHGFSAGLLPAAPPYHLRIPPFHYSSSLLYAALRAGCRRLPFATSCYNSPVAAPPLHLDRAPAITLRRICWTRCFACTFLTHGISSPLFSYAAQLSKHGSLHKVLCVFFMSICRCHTPLPYYRLRCRAGHTPLWDTPAFGRSGFLILRHCARWVGCLFCLARMCCLRRTRIGCAARTACWFFTPPLFRAISAHTRIYGLSADMIMVVLRFAHDTRLLIPLCLWVYTLLVVHTVTPTHSRALPSRRYGSVLKRAAFACAFFALSLR